MSHKEKQSVAPLHFSEVLLSGFSKVSALAKFRTDEGKGQDTVTPGPLLWDKLTGSFYW